MEFVMALKCKLVLVQALELVMAWEWELDKESVMALELELVLMQTMELVMEFS